MQVVAKLFFLLFISIFTTHLYAEGCSVFNPTEVTSIRKGLKEGFIPIKENGTFSMPAIVDNGKDLAKELESEGVIATLFSDESFYFLFMKYLKRINNSPDNFKNKNIKYINKGVEYVFTLSCDENEILITINILGEEVEDFGKPESMIIYYFERSDDNKITLSKMNAAG